MLKAFFANKALLVNPRGEVLFVRDAGTSEGHELNEGKWDIPGGRMEEDETPLEGLVREIEEEIGVLIDPATAKPIYVNKWYVGGKKEFGAIVGVFYVVPIPEDVEIKLSSEHSELRWVNLLEEIPEDMVGIEEHVRSYRDYKKHD